MDACMGGDSGVWYISRMFHVVAEATGDGTGECTWEGGRESFGTVGGDVILLEGENMSSGASQAVGDGKARNMLPCDQRTESLFRSTGRSGFVGSMMDTKEKRSLSTSSSSSPVVVRLLVNGRIVNWKLSDSGNAGRVHARRFFRCSLSSSSIVAKNHSSFSVMSSSSGMSCSWKESTGGCVELELQACMEVTFISD